MRNYVTSSNRQAIAFRIITHDITTNWLHMFHSIIPIRPCRTIPLYSYPQIYTQKRKETIQLWNNARALVHCRIATTLATSLLVLVNIGVQPQDLHSKIWNTVQQCRHPPAPPLTKINGYKRGITCLSRTHQTHAIFQAKTTRLVFVLLDIGYPTYLKFCLFLQRNSPHSYIRFGVTP